MRATAVAAFGVAALVLFVVVLLLCRPRATDGRPVTDHPVTIFEGNGYLVALCDIDNCAWMEFANPGDLAAQEAELRYIIASRHTKAVVPEVKRRGAA